MTAEQIISRNKLNCDDASFPEQTARLLDAAEQEIQSDWDVYAKYKCQLNDIPLDPFAHTDALRQLAEILDL